MRIDKEVTYRIDGSARIRYRAVAGNDPLTGKRRRKLFKRRAEAKIWLETLHERESPAISETNPAWTLAWIGEQYVADRKNVGRERSTWEKYDQHFKQHINLIEYKHTNDDRPEDASLDGKTFGSFVANSICPRHFAKLKSALVSTRSHAMALRIWSTLCAALDYGITIECVTANIARRIKIDRKPRETDRTIEIPSKQEIKLLMASTMPVDGNPISIGQVMIALTITTGLRPSEMRALSWSCVRIDEPPYYVTVTERVDQWRVSGPPKSAAGYREIPIPEPTAKILGKWRSRCPKSGDLNLVFPTSTGTYWSHSNIHNRIWGPYQVGLGICVARMEGGKPVFDDKGQPVMEGRYTWYAMRHAYASMLIELGVKPKMLQARMGHASVLTTMNFYGHLWTDRSQDALDMARMESWLAALAPELKTHSDLKHP